MQAMTAGAPGNGQRAEERDNGVFMVNNEIVTNDKNLELLIKKQIEKHKSVSNEPIMAEILTSLNTPYESIKSCKEILSKENVPLPGRRW